MILASREEEGLHNVGVAFTVSLCPEEGGENVELMPGGSSVAVTTENVYDYVHKYAQLRMVHISEEPLQVSACNVAQMCSSIHIARLCATQLGKGLLFWGGGDNYKYDLIQCHCVNFGYFIKVAAVQTLPRLFSTAVNSMSLIQIFHVHNSERSRD